MIKNHILTALIISTIIFTSVIQGVDNTLDWLSAGTTIMYSAFGHGFISSIDEDILENPLNCAFTGAVHGLVTACCAGLISGCFPGKMRAILSIILLLTTANNIDKLVAKKKVFSYQIINCT